MIAYLKGRVLRRDEASVVVECGGVGYEVVLPAYLAAHLASRDGSDDAIELFVSYQVSANQPRPVLVGFLREVEQEFFERLITVDGLGPAKAVRAIATPVHEIADAIERKDVAYLRQLPGLGARTAEKVVAALHGKMGKFALLRDDLSAQAGAFRTEPVENVDIQSEVLEVLTRQLGHRPAEARRMVEEAVRRNPAVTTTEELFQEVYRAQKDEG